MSPRFILLTVIFSSWVFLPDSVNAAEVADWGDVVNVQYTLYDDAQHTNPVTGNIDQIIEYIYLSRSSSVPSEITQLYRDASAGYLEKFKEGIVGMEVGKQRNVNVDADDGYSTDPNHPLYGKDLYFVIKLLEILYDASEHTTITTTTTTSSSTPFQGLTEILLFGGGAVILGGGFVLWRFRVSRMYKSALSSEETKSVKQAKSFQKEKDHLKELRKLTESVTDSEETTKKTEVKFRPRRR